MGLCSDSFEKGKSWKNTLSSVTTIPRGADKLPNANKMNASFLLGIWVLDHMKLGRGAEFRNFGERDEVVDFLAIKLQVEAGVLKRRRKVNDGLSDLMNLFLRRNLNSGKLKVSEEFGISQNGP
ncbi:hypothetical protein HG530_014170 [Fusarium avenaceum]|nr:hypothetical protein HG530_014170 [Fusarium avenaceum]